jgi:hypothetical protein
MIRSLLLVVTVVVGFSATGQNVWLPSDTLNKPRRNAVLISGGTVAVGSLALLYGAWYSDYEQQPFHFTPDWNNWNQMDKLGHAWSAYTIGFIGSDLLLWSGVQPRKAAWTAATAGWSYLLVVEVMDGFSSGWGFSWGDVAFNTAGSGLFLAQQLAWKEQRMRLKFSYLPSNYAVYNPELLGNGGVESILKDYNGQTYWLSVNLNDFGAEWMPEWLCLSVGYGSTGMVSAEPNPELESSLGITRQRLLHLSLDLDLSRIKTKSPFLNAVFKKINFLKIPAPTLTFETQTRNFNGSVLYF